MKLELKEPSPTEEQTKALADWKEAKRGKLGGSSAPAAVGLGQHGSQYKLWARMTGREEEPDLGGIEYVHWGNVLEPVVVREMEERTGAEVLEDDGLTPELEGVEFLGRFGFRNPWQPLYARRGRPWQCFSPDGFCTKDGEVGLIEAKTTGQWASAKWDEEPPAPVIIQAQHGMSVLGLNYAMVPVLVGGNDFRVYRVERDDALQSVLVEREEAFMDLVLNDTPPEPDDDPDTLKTLKRLHPDDNGESIMLSHDLTEADERRQELLQMRKDIKKELDYLESQFRHAITANTYGRIPGTKIVYSLKTSERKGHYVEATKYRALRRKEEK